MIYSLFFIQAGLLALCMHPSAAFSLPAPPTKPLELLTNISDFEMRIIHNGEDKIFIWYSYYVHQQMVSMESENVHIVFG